MSLIPLVEFEKSGVSPVNLRGLVFRKGPLLEQCGVLVRYGRKLLIDPDLLDEWLRENSHEGVWS
jgi:hypothetical protein